MIDGEKKSGPPIAVHNIVDIQVQIFSLVNVHCISINKTKLLYWLFFKLNLMISFWEHKIAYKRI